MDQPQVRFLFEEMDTLMFRALGHILAVSGEWAIRQLLQEVETVLSGSTHGRLIYVKQGTRDADEARFISAGARLFNLLSYGLGSAAPGALLLPALRAAVQNASYVRISLDAIVNHFCTVTSRYPDLLAGIAKVQAMQHRYTGPQMNRALRARPQLEHRAHAVERLLGADRFRLATAVRDVLRLRAQYLTIRESVLWSYARVVYREAVDYAQPSQHLQIMENFQNGAAGLVRALLLYNHTRNVHFGSFARTWVNQQILHYLKEQSGTIKLSAVVWQAHTKIEEIRAMHFARTGSYDLPDDIEQNFGVRVRSLDDSIRASQVGSLQQRVNPDDSTTIEGSIRDDSRETAVQDEAVSSRLQAALSRLPISTRRVLALHYGMQDMLPDGGTISEEMVAVECARQTGGLGR